MAEAALRQVYAMELRLDADPEDLVVWMQEADEQLQVLDESLIRLEKESGDVDLLQSIFRAAHTLKGGSASIKHTRMAQLTHAMEGVLDELRNLRLNVSSELIDVLLGSLDHLGLLRDEVTSMTVNEDVSVDSLVERLTALKERAGTAVAETAPAAAQFAGDVSPKTDSDGWSPELTSEQTRKVSDALARSRSVLRVSAVLAADSALPAARKLQILN